MFPLDVVVLGSYVQDHCWLTRELPARGETRIGTFATFPGGKGFNQAVACHRQGVKTCFLGSIGRDALGESARRYARDFELPCEWEQHDDIATAAASVVVDARGDNLICVALGANEAMSSAFVHARERLIADAKVLVCQLECNLGAVRTALSCARANGTLSILNPAPINDGLTRELLELADIVTPNETEFLFLLERCFDKKIAPRFWELSDALLHQLCRVTGIPTVVLTLGERGVFVSHADAKLRKDIDAYYRVEAETVHVKDTVGAGDAFSGGLAAGMIRYHFKQSFRQAVIYANRVAGLSTEKAGAAPAMPSHADVKARFPG
jgi:ribokinase